jgi:hypothetical protein
MLREDSVCRKYTTGENAIFLARFNQTQLMGAVSGLLFFQTRTERF